MKTKLILSLMVQKAVLLCAMMSLVAGLTIISSQAIASEPVCIARTTAEACKNKIEAFDALADEAKAVQRQRDEAVGARNEIRVLYFDALADATDWQLKAKAAQASLDKSPSRLVWFGTGVAAGAGSVILILVFMK